MPRPTNSPYHKAACTPAQKEAVKLAASKVGVGEGEFIRLSMRRICAQLSIDYPDDLPERGKHKRIKPEPLPRGDCDE